MDKIKDKRWRKVCHDHNQDVILDNSPMPDGRTAVVRDQIALVDITLPDGSGNGDLIAAAPDLLAALDHIGAVMQVWRERHRNLESGKFYNEITDEIKTIQAAIAKASQ